MQGAAGNGARQRCSTEGQSADQQVDPGPCRRAGRDTATDPHAQLLEGFRVEQIITPTAIEQRQISGRRVLRAKGVELEQGFDATLFPLSNGFAQLVDGSLFLLGVADHATSAGGAIDQ
ncbi:hypothetical protein D3C86_1498430 [compost metagenome]